MIPAANLAVSFRALHRQTSRNRYQSSYEIHHVPCASRICGEVGRFSWGGWGMDVGLDPIEASLVTRFLWCISLRHSLVFSSIEHLTRAE
ncbi:unnamed protein product [Peniophora sp. CBMAI 1063]|nr:unnamed protein product [Peniophora sp. CBMAI 1063]